MGVIICSLNGRAFGMHPKVGGSSSLSRDTFCLKFFDTFSKTPVLESKMNAFACIQLTFQMLTLQEISRSG